MTSAIQYANLLLTFQCIFLLIHFWPSSWPHFTVASDRSGGKTDHLRCYGGIPPPVCGGSQECLPEKILFRFFRRRHQRQKISRWEIGFPPNKTGAGGRKSARAFTVFCHLEQSFTLESFAYYTTYYRCTVMFAPDRRKFSILQQLLRTEPILFASLSLSRTP